jgi:hypothetical protein
MWPLNQHPFHILILSLVVLGTSVWCGGALLTRFKNRLAWSQADFNMVQTATLTLLSLIIGFTFSMAIDRFDQRKALEEAEANSISTAILRADLLPNDARTQIKLLLAQYLEQRILFYSAEESALAPIKTRTTALQNQLWRVTAEIANAQPTPTVALAVASISDVISAEGHYQGASWNTIPRPAWWLLATIAICANLMFGFGSHHFNSHRSILFTLPLIISITFFLIADIDSPRSGSIRVIPQNLMNLAQTLNNVAP